MKTLFLERFGMDIQPDDACYIEGGLNNHRLRAAERIEGVNGRFYLMEFLQGNRWKTRTAHKITGAPLKHPKQEVINNNALWIDSEYEDNNGCWRDSKLEQKAYDENLSFTASDILKFVNGFSREKFTDVFVLPSHCHNGSGIEKLKEWNFGDYEKIHNAVLTAFEIWQKNNLVILQGSGKKSEYIFGLPYTSTSEYAGLWNCQAVAHLINYPDFYFESISIETPHNGGAIANIYATFEREDTGDFNRYDIWIASIRTKDYSLIM